MRREARYPGAPLPVPRKTPLGPGRIIHWQERSPFMDARWHWQRRIAQILAPTMIVLLIFWLGYFAVLRPHMRDSFHAQQRAALADVMEMTVNGIETIRRQGREDGLPTREIQRRALEFVRSLRHGPDQREYVWVQDRSGLMLMHPVITSLDSTSILDVTDSHGKYFGREILEITAAHSQGYLTYTWPHPADTTRYEEKISLVRRYEPWNWVLGTGLYIRDAEAELGEITGRLNLLAMIALVGATGLIAWIAHVSFSFERRRVTAEQDRERLVGELQTALQDVRELRGLLPICAHCKKIRNDSGYWQEVEVYVGEHTEATFTHGICPDCRAEFMRGLPHGSLHGRGTGGEKDAGEGPEGENRAASG